MGEEQVFQFVSYITLSNSIILLQNSASPLASQLGRQTKLKLKWKYGISHFYFNLPPKAQNRTSTECKLN
jgi:hypothetical protein